MRCILFTRKHCGICDDALYNLSIIQKNIPSLSIVIKDIDDSENIQWKKLYHLSVPVIHVREWAYKSPFDWKDLSLEIRKNVLDS